MAAITRLSSFGYGTRRNGSFLRINPLVVPSDLADVATTDGLVTLLATADGAVNRVTTTDALVINATITEWPT